MSVRLLVLFALALWATGEVVVAEEVRPPEAVILKNGDRMSGTSLGVENGRLEWELPYGNSIWIPLEEIDRVERFGEVPPLPESTPSAPVATAAVPPAIPVSPVPDSAVVEPSILEPWWHYRRVGKESFAMLTDWTKRVAFGGRFVEGNSQETNFDLNANLERKRRDRQTQINLGGQFGQANGVRGVNRWFANSTTDITVDDPWVFFLNVNDEYNERQNLDYRGSLSFGPGWRPYNEDKKRFIIRGGPAVTYEIFHQPADQRVSPDLFGEVELRWPLNDRVQLEHRTTVNQGLHDLHMIRATTNSAVQLALDSEKRWSFRLGLQYQYISQPNAGRKPGDYWTTIQLVYQKK